MNNPFSPEEYNSDEDDWSEINTPSPPLSDDNNNNSWILISHHNLLQEEEDDSSSSSSSSSSKEIETLDDHKVTCSLSLSSASSSENFISVLIRERVLHRLPAKQLLNLRTVSHQWNNFITSPFFIHSHSQSSTSSISGVFYHNHHKKPSSFFNPFDSTDLHGVQSPDLKFLPEPVSVLSSSRGLLCCKAAFSNYFIVNPLTGSWVLLPPPANDHGQSPAAVIVFDEPFVFNFSLDYKLVVAYDLGDKCYGFEVFSSKEWEWSVSSELCVTEWIEPESGVAAGGCAHWRTSMQTVVSYNPEVDRNWEVVWPESYEEDVVWELGEIDGRLSCVCVKGDEVCVYGMEEGNGGWKEVRKMRKWDGSGGEVRVVRVQEVREVVVVENGRLFGWSLEDGSWREGYLFMDEGCERFVSFVGSLLHAYGSWG